jgi:Flp pilus assembly protein TadB
MSLSRAMLARSPNRKRAIEYLAACGATAITIINRPYANTLYECPKLLLVMGAFMAAGGYWMRRIVNFDF